MSLLQHVTISRNDSLYESFPDVVISGDGRLVVVFREADQHIAQWSQLVLMDSRDAGLTWNNRRVLDRQMSLEVDGAVWNCPRIVRQKDGGLTVICDLSVYPPQPSWLPVSESQLRFRTYLWRSFDNGKTWSSRKLTRIQGLAPDRLLELTDDTWVIGSHYHSLRHFNTLTQVVTISRDAGENWTNLSIIAEIPGMQFCEGSIARCRDGRLVCYMRENSMRNIPTHKSFSFDGGLHWSLPQPTRFVGHRPVAALLRSGKMLVTYRDVRLKDAAAIPPVGANTATMAWLGDPLDESSGRLLMIDHDSSGVFADYGYSGWVQLPDNRIFCAYHHRGEAPLSYIKGGWFRESDFTEILDAASHPKYY